MTEGDASFNDTTAKRMVANSPVDEDDVDLFVSPRRFGGATPSAKAARDRAFTAPIPPFEEEYTRQPAQKETGREDCSYDIGGDFTNLRGKAQRQTYRSFVGQRKPNCRFVFVRFCFHASNSKEMSSVSRPLIFMVETKSYSIAETIHQEKLTRQRIQLHHFVLLFLGVLNLGVGIWMVSKNGDKVLAKDLSNGSFVLREPRHYAVSMVSVGIGMLVIGSLGSFSLTHSMAAGFLRTGDAWQLGLYQLLVFLTAPTLILLLTEACHTFVDAKRKPTVPSGNQLNLFLSATVVPISVSIITLFSAVIVSASSAWAGMRHRSPPPGARDDFQTSF